MARPRPGRWRLVAGDRVALRPVLEQLRAARTSCRRARRGRACAWCRPRSGWGPRRRGRAPPPGAWPRRRRARRCRRPRLAEAAVGLRPVHEAGVGGLHARWASSRRTCCSRRSAQGSLCTQAKFQPSWKAPVEVPPSPIQVSATVRLPFMRSARTRPGQDRDHVARASRPPRACCPRRRASRSGVLRSRPRVGPVGLGHVLAEHVARPAAPHEDGAQVADEGREDVAALQRVGAAHRAGLLAEAAVEAAHHLALPVEVGEPLLHHAVELQVVVELEELGLRELGRRAVSAI